jgi:hypothetical protein
MIAEEAKEILFGTLTSHKLRTPDRTLRGQTLCLEITGKVPSNHRKAIPFFISNFQI